MAKKAETRTATCRAGHLSAFRESRGSCLQFLLSLRWGKNASSNWMRCNLRCIILCRLSADAELSLSEGPLKVNENCLLMDNSVVCGIDWLLHWTLHNLASRNKLEALLEYFGSMTITNQWHWRVTSSISVPLIDFLTSNLGKLSARCIIEPTSPFKFCGKSQSWKLFVAHFW